MLIIVVGKFIYLNVGVVMIRSIFLFLLVIVNE